MYGANDFMHPINLMISAELHPQSQREGGEGPHLRKTDKQTDQDRSRFPGRKVEHLGTLPAAEMEGKALGGGTF